MNKKVWIYLMFTFILLLSFYTYTRPINIEQTYDGIIYSDQSNFQKLTKIIIRGSMKRHVLSGNELNGKLIVDNDIEVDLHMERYDDKFIELKSSTNQHGSVKVTGHITISKNLKWISFQIDEINQRYYTDCEVAAPAKDRIEANKVLTELFHL